MHNKRQLDIRSIKCGLQDRLSESTTSLQSCTFYRAPKDRFEEGRSIVSNSGNVSQTSDRESAESRISGILQPFFHCSEKGTREMEVDSESKQPKQFCGERKFQNGDRRIGEEYDKAGRVGVFDRFLGCLLPCTDSSISQEVSKIHHRQSSVPVQSSANGSFLFGQSLHQNHQMCERICPDFRSSYAPVLGRLAGEIDGQEFCTGSHRSDCVYRSVAGVAGELQKVGTDPQPGDSVSWLSPLLQARNNQAYKRKVGEDQEESKTPPTKRRSFSQGVSTCNWDTGFNREDDSSRYDSSASYPVVSSAEIFSIQGRSLFDNSCIKSSARSSEVVDAGNKYFSGSSVQDRTTPIPHTFRCQYPRLGWGSEWGRDQRFLDERRDRLPYKCQRIISSREDAKCLCSQSPGTDSTFVHGQYLSACVPQKGRGHAEQTFVRGDISDLQTSRDLGYISNLQTHSRKAECECGPVVEERTDFSDGVVITSVSGESTMGSMGQASCRSLRNSPQLQTTSVCVPSTRPSSLGSGCVVDKLGRSSSLRFSSNSNSRKSAYKNKSGIVCNSVDSPMVAKTILVHTNSRASNRFSNRTASGRETIETTPVNDFSQQARDLPASCVEVITRSLQERGFSEKAARRIAKPQKQSSIDVYQSKWECFRNWCTARNQDPFKATVELISDFLIYLHEDKQLSYSTIEGYRAALGHVFRNVSNLDLGDNPFISSLMANLSRDRRNPRCSLPPWDLSVVLKALTMSPFEPIRKSDLKWLTLKTVFLITLASGRRRSEIHALRLDSMTRGERWEFVSLQPDPAFISKTELGNKGLAVLRPIVIPALKQSVDKRMKEDLTLCPVRALKFYIRKTEDLRANRDKLFISMKKGHIGDIKKNTVSFWIRKMITKAYELQELELLGRVRAHDVRGMASSWAFLRNISLEEILAACGWKSHSTFTSFYLKDLTVQGDNLLKLGPVVVAQSTV